MKKFFFIFFVFLFLSRINVAVAQQSFYQNLPDIDPISCGCPAILNEVYNSRGEKCVTTYDEFKADPRANHFWVNDPKITEQGQADERARQFIYWVITHPSIDNHPGIMAIWKLTRNITYFLTIFIVVLFGLGYIIGQRSNFDLGIKIWPSVYKTLLMLLYISFSASIVISVIQISDILMKFFIENLKGNQLFNIFFTGPESIESNYLNFYGCHDLNFHVQEAANSQIFLLKITNITYYIMGTMLILRKIILWFLLFVSPFLALLMPFIFIRNVGWIWIGVFFQWVFYGPLFALFLGALAKIWQNGIPFLFDFSRVNKPEGYIFPTAINIFYGGPAQTLSIMNSGNYIDTFAEYVITLIMLWAATFFPWWLLRIFRDYCCEGIYAMKNILMSMYDQMRGAPSTPPQPSLSPTTIATALKMPKEVEIPVKLRLETIEEIKKAKTEEIARSLTMETRRLTDIARLETNKELRETVTRHINYLKNPIAAETPTERQKFMNLKTELYQRALKQDVVAKNIVSVISSSTIEQQKVREEVLKTVPEMKPVTQTITYIFKVPQPKAVSTINTIFNQFTTNNQLINQIAQTNNISTNQIQSIFNSLKQHLLTTQPTQIVDKISQETGIEKEKIKTVIKQFKDTAKNKEEIVKMVAQQENLELEKVKKIIDVPVETITEPQNNIEKTIIIPPTVTIDEYEEVKKMWIDHYERGELPISENITNRHQWVKRDIVLITNTLNKLLSADPKLKQEGLDDVSYILPVFLINNLSGEQLVAYLKAKIEAAKEVEKLLEKEEEITQKLKEKAKEEEEVLIKIDKNKKTDKTMKMEKEAENKKENKEKIDDQQS